MLFRKDAVTKSKSRKCKLVGTLAVIGGKLLLIVLRMQESRRLVFEVALD